VLCLRPGFCEEKKILFTGKLFARILPENGAKIIDVSARVYHRNVSIIIISPLSFPLSFPIFNACVHVAHGYFQPDIFFYIINREIIPADKVESRDVPLSAASVKIIANLLFNNVNKCYIASAPAVSFINV